MDVIAVVVTRNRLELLKGTIAHLISQTVELSKIVIVDNASTDGTTDYLKEEVTEPVFDIIYSETNEGGAGGFYRGIKRAYELGCDAVWIMDDDTYPTETALEELIKDYRYLQGAGSKVGFITSNALFKDGKPCLMNVSNPVYLWNEHIKHGLVRVGHCSFVSMFIPTNVIADLGLPVKEFFIWGDDGEYSTRIAEKYEGYMSGNSTVYHMMSENVGVNIFTTPKDRINRFYYFYRNWMFTNSHRGPEARKQFEKDTEELIKKIKQSDTPYKKEKIETIRRGLRDGKTFDAHIEKVHESTREDDELVKSDEESKKDTGITIPKIMERVAQKWPNTDYGYIQFQYQRYKRLPDYERSDYNFLKKGLSHSKIYCEENRSKSFRKLMNEVSIEPVYKGCFVTSIDYYKNWCILFRQMDNAAVDYRMLIDNGLKNLFLNEDNGFAIENDCVLQGIIEYLERLKAKVEKSDNPSKKLIARNLDSFINQNAESLEDALQRIVIISQMLWQTGHYLVGLGRVDCLVDEFIKSDKRSDEEITSILENFIAILHEYYWYKSSALLGDTGQIIILGGLEEDGSYFSNRVTYLMIEALNNLQLPDPKVLLRVSENTPKDLFDLAIKTIATGVGSPLLSNDDVVIKSLIDFGYESEDAHNYVTSACWEPIPGNSFEQNNIAHINFVEPFKLVSEKEVLTEIKTYEEYLHLFENHLYGHAEFICNSLDGIVWEFDPLVSALMENCRNTRTDVSIGGCKYNNYGILTNGLSNAVNSLLTLKKIVFEEKRISLLEFDHQLIENYTDNQLYEVVKSTDEFFGHDEEDVIHLTNELMYVVSDAASKYRNKFGGTAKIGTSSPSYITLGETTRASFDGRLDGEAFGTHISTKGSVPYTELFNFASKINYGRNMFNGNVVDLVVSPDFMLNNLDKFVLLMKGALKAGIFETQINVIDSKQLKLAKEHPEQYQNLIVRVWGFSAYFVQLPEDYQDLLIQRAEQNESYSN